MRTKLTIELVPSTCWYTNVRSNVSDDIWDLLRKDAYKKAGYRCEICGGKGDNHPVECHEIWDYDDDNLIQTLVGLIALCPTCHKVKHPGLAQINGEEQLVLDQLVKVNGIDITEAIDYLNNSFVIWQERSQHKWELDINFIDRYKDPISKMNDLMNKFRKN